MLSSFSSVNTTGQWSIRKDDLKMSNFNSFGCEGYWGVLLAKMYLHKQSVANYLEQNTRESC